MNDVITKDSRIVYFRIRTDNDLVRVDNQSIVFPLSIKMEEIEQKIKENVVSHLAEKRSKLGESLIGKKFKVSG